MIAARVLAIAVLAAVFGAPATARAQGGNGCAISATGVNFGTYNVFSAAPVQSTGGLTFRCGAAVAAVRVSLSTGQSGTFSPRTLTGTGDGLAYNLYRNAGRTEIWGDGSGGTFDMPMTPEKNTWIPLTIYAQIPPLQDVRAGAYTDTITAIIQF